MSKINFLLLSFCLLIILTSSTIPTNTNPDDYLNLQNYQSYNYKNHYNYYHYIKNHPKQSLISALNHINYPEFLNPNNSINKAIGNDYTILVNRTHYLDQFYIPQNLTIISTVPIIERQGQVMKVVKTVLNAYEELYAEALLHNINLTIFSAYRSYEYQVGLNEGRDEDDMYIAKPGHSEHQTGLVLDISTLDCGLTEYFDNTLASKYLRNNAHHFGFILRYPKDKTSITGYNFESWHYRYVGKQIATFIFENNLTLEEYLYNYTEIIYTN